MHMKFFDSHCHPQLSAFDADREAVLARMQGNEVGGVVVGVDFETSKKAVELAHIHNFLWASVGLHPNGSLDEEFNIPESLELPRDENENLNEKFNARSFSELAHDTKVVAIGECGLDFFRLPADAGEQGRHMQKERFQKHIELALKTRKPLIIHCRSSAGGNDAHEAMLVILGSHARELEKGELKAVMHFFTSTAGIAKQYLSLGCFISFPCVITFTDMYDEAVRAIPLERILSETDSPFASPARFRGKRNEPIYVEEAVKRIAELKGLPFSETAEQIV